ncbi:hypothetical protein ACVWW1_003433 [Bradyrhizobium sp. JR3.5]
MRDVTNNRVDFGGLKRAALDLVADGIETLRRGRGAHGDEPAHRLGETPKRRLGKAEFVRTHQRVFVGDQEGSKQDVRITAQFDPTEAAKDFGLQSARMARNHDDVFPARIETNPTDFQLGAGSVRAFGHGRSTPDRDWKCDRCRDESLGFNYGDGRPVRIPCGCQQDFLERHGALPLSQKPSFPLSVGV